MTEVVQVVVPWSSLINQRAHKLYVCYCIQLSVDHSYSVSTVLIFFAGSIIPRSTNRYCMLDLIEYLTAFGSLIYWRYTRRYVISIQTKVKKTKPSYVKTGAIELCASSSPFYHPWCLDHICYAPLQAQTWPFPCLEVSWESPFCVIVDCIGHGKVQGVTEV